MRKNVIILFHPRTLHEKNYRNYHVPYSILAVASNIDQKNYQIILVDDNVQKKESYRGVIVQVRNRLLCVGISSMVGAQIMFALSFAKEVRDLIPGCPIVWGGPLPTLLPELTTSNELVDIAVIGQGETTFREIIDHLDQNKSLVDIRGIAYKNKLGKVHINSSRSFVDINLFPPYTTVYPLLHLEDYIWPDEHISERTISYHSSQGCPFSCGFCCEVPLWKRVWYGLSVKRILDDIRYLKNKYSIEGIKFYDSEFFIDRKRAKDFATELIANKMKICWGASAHPKTIYSMGDNEISILKQSGLTRLLIGGESGVTQELELIKKCADKKMIFEIAKKCAHHGIMVCFTFITGYPSMPDHYIDETLAFAEELKRVEPSHEMKLHFYGPYPGTPLYGLALDYGFQAPTTLEDWANYDYYEILTPWVSPRYAPILRKFNEENYPYVHPFKMKSEI